MQRASYVFPVGIQIIEKEVVTSPLPESVPPQPEPTGNPKLDAWAAVRFAWRTHQSMDEIRRLTDEAKKAVDTRYAPPATD